MLALYHDDYTNDEIGRRTARIDTQPGSTTTHDFGYNVRSELISAGMNTNQALPGFPCDF